MHPSGIVRPWARAIEKLEPCGTHSSATAAIVDLLVRIVGSGAPDGSVTVCDRAPTGTCSSTPFLQFDFRFVHSLTPGLRTDDVLFRCWSPSYFGTVLNDFISVKGFAHAVFKCESRGWWRQLIVLFKNLNAILFSHEFSSRARFGGLRHSIASQSHNTFAHLIRCRLIRGEARSLSPTDSASLSMHQFVFPSPHLSPWEKGEVTYFVSINGFRSVCPGG